MVKSPRCPVTIWDSSSPEKKLSKMSLNALPAARVHTSYGIGLRFSLERTAVFRADLGFSREDVNVTVGFGLSF